jgi:hypothetical protein
MAARVFVVSPPWVKVKSNGVSLGHAIASVVESAPSTQPRAFKACKSFPGLLG